MNSILNNRWVSLFDETFFQDVFDVLNSKTSYPYNIHAYTDKVVVEVPLAGYKRDNISLEIENNVLSLKVTRKEEKDSSGKLVHHGIKNKELLFRWNLQSSLDQDSVESVFEDGLLTITIKAKQKQDNKKQIIIK